MMKVNEGFSDRLIRVVLGAGVLAAPFFVEPSPWLYVAIFPLGVVPLLTGIFGICPLYAMLGVNSLGKRD